MKALGQSLLKDDQGQASAEYILMLAMGVAMGISVIKKFIQPYLAKMADTFSTQMQSSLFNKANMHTFKMGH